MLVGVFNSGILATGSVAHAKFDYADAPVAVVDKVKAIEAICRKHKVTLRQAAIQFAFAIPPSSRSCSARSSPRKSRRMSTTRPSRYRPAFGRTSSRPSFWTRPRPPRGSGDATGARTSAPAKESQRK